MFNSLTYDENSNQSDSETDGSTTDIKYEPIKSCEECSVELCVPKHFELYHTHIAYIIIVYIKTFKFNQVFVSSHIKYIVRISC